MFLRAVLGGGGGGRGGGRPSPRSGVSPRPNNSACRVMKRTGNSASRAMNITKTTPQSTVKLGAQSTRSCAQNDRTRSKEDDSRTAKKASDSKNNPRSTRIDLEDLGDVDESPVSFRYLILFTYRTLLGLTPTKHPRNLRPNDNNIVPQLFR